MNYYIIIIRIYFNICLTIRIYLQIFVSSFLVIFPNMSSLGDYFLLFLLWASNIFKYLVVEVSVFQIYLRICSRRFFFKYIWIFVWTLFQIFAHPSKCRKVFQYLVHGLWSEVSSSHYTESRGETTSVTEGHRTNICLTFTLFFNDFI